jgi:hypothetical protein
VTRGSLAAGHDAAASLLTDALAPGPDMASVGKAPRKRRRTTSGGDGPSPAEVRAWAQAAGYAVSDRGRVRRDIVEAYVAAHQP